MKHLIILLLVFFVVLITHFGSKNITSFDSRWVIYTASSIIKYGDTNLDEYKEIIPNNDYRIENINGHLYSIFPIGVSVITIPFVFIIDKSGLFYFNLEEFQTQGFSPLYLELFIASLFIALTAVFIFLIACLFLKRNYSLLVTFIFAFCTSAWSTASRGLWQHGPSMLMLTITLYLILLAKNKPWLVQFASIPLAFSYVIRPTNSLSIFLLTIFVLFQYRQYFFRYSLWAMTIVIPFLLFNLSIYHSFLSPYYMPQKIGSNPHFFEALAGNLISPARGLFIFSPTLLFSIYGIILKIQNASIQKLDYCLFSSLFLHWIVISSFPHWWAGWSFGPRFFSDMIPYFIYFLIPAVVYLSKLQGIKNAVFLSIFLGFIGISFFIHYRGATNWDVYAWNAEPVDIDRKPTRLWDWEDIQFLRGIIK